MGERKDMFPPPTENTPHLLSPPTLSFLSLLLCEWLPTKQRINNCQDGIALPFLLEGTRPLFPGFSNLSRLPKELRLQAKTTVNRALLSYLLKLFFLRKLERRELRIKEHMKLYSVSYNKL